MQKIILFGTGDRGRKLFHFLKEIGANILFWIDSDSQKWDTELFHVPVCNPKKVLEYKDSIICIAAIDPKREMYQTLCAYGINPKRIYSFSEMIIESGKSALKNSVREEKKICARPDILFDCTNGLGLGGVEAWSMQAAAELENYGKHAFLAVPQNSRTANSHIAERLLSLRIEAADKFSAENIRSVIEGITSKLPCIVITSCVNDFFLAACIVKEWYPDQIKIISVVHQGILAAYKEQSDVMQYADRYVGVSRDICEGLALQGINTDIILHMTCPVACGNMQKRSYTLDRLTPLHIGYAGRLEIVQKRLDLLLVLLEEMDQLKVNYFLEIAGTGEYLKEILKYIHRACLEDRVRLLGTLDRSEISDFWSRQDICINLSDYEGRSISIMEAMANGAVPVVTKTSGVREDITDAQSGFLAETGDCHKMALAIKGLEERRYLLKSMGMKAYESISAKCNMEDHMKFWNQVLEEVW